MTLTKIIDDVAIDNIKIPCGDTITFENEVKSSLQLLLNKIESSSDPFHELDTSSIKHLSTLLSTFPIKKLYKEVGEETLFWTWINQPNVYAKNDYAKELFKVIDVSFDYLQKLEFSLSEENINYDAQTIYQYHSFIQKMKSYCDDFLIRDDLQKYAKENISLSDKRKNNYSLDFFETVGDSVDDYEKIWGQNSDNNKLFYEVYLDTPFALSLFYKNRPNAVVGFTPTKKDTIMIKQVQGVKPRNMNVKGFSLINESSDVKKVCSRGLFPLQWESLLVSMVKDIIEKSNYDYLAIQGAINNTYTHSQDPGHKISLEYAQKRYDSLARNLGFEERDDGNFYIPVKECKF